MVLGTERPDREQYSPSTVNARLLRLALAVALSACTTPTPTPTVTPTPGTPTWTTFGELSHPRAYAAALALPSGEILVVGGLDRDDPDVTNTDSELVNVKTGAVTVLREQLLGRLHQTMTSAADRVVVAGGVMFQKTHWDPVDRVDVYIPLDRKWITASSLIDARSDHAAVALLDGRVMVIGGNQGPRLLQSVEVYDGKKDQWTRVSPLPTPRTLLSAFTLKDGRVLVAGGLDSSGKATDTTYLYDPAKDQWSEGPRMTLPRVQHAALQLASGDILFIGGDGAASGTSDRYDAKNGIFIRSGTLGEPRQSAQAAQLLDGRVVLIGGMPPRNTEFAPLRTAEIWDPASELWSELPPSPTARAWPIVVIVGGAVYQLSGTGDAEVAYRTIERLAVN